LGFDGPFIVERATPKILIAWSLECGIAPGVVEEIVGVASSFLVTEIHVRVTVIVATKGRVVCVPRALRFLGSSGRSAKQLLGLLASFSRQVVL
jgi:hypothetical protein